MNPLLSASELAAVQEVALSGMQTSVTVWRKSNVSTDDGMKSTWTQVGKPINGWLHSTPTPVITLVSGALATVNTYRLFLPVGSDVTPGDQVTIGSMRYVLSDTTNDETWPALLRCSLRLAE